MDSYFDVNKVTRMIALGTYPVDVIVPHFIPLVKTIIRTGVAYDSRNQEDKDLLQVGLIKSMEVIEQFSVSQGNLLGFATKLIRHALWSEARLRPIDRQRVSDDTDFDKVPSISPVPTEQRDCKLTEEILKKFRMEDPSYKKAAEYVFGVLSSNEYEQNRARVLKTLTYGYDINPKYARFLVDHVVVLLRQHYSRGPREIRDDAMFNNRFKLTLVPELRNLLGERAFERLIHFFGGITMTIPSMDQINNIDRDMSILKALAYAWSCGPTLSKKYGISPEGIKAVFKSCLHSLHTDPEYRQLIAKHIDLNKIPGFDNPAASKKVKKPFPAFGERRPAPRRKMNNTDSMGFTLGCRNSLLYTLIITGKCTREDLVNVVVSKFGGSESTAKSTVSAFLSDIKHPFGKFNTSRNLNLLRDSNGRLSFEKRSLEAAQRVVAARRQAQIVALTA